MSYKQTEYIEHIDYYWIEALFDPECRIILSSEQMEFLLAFESLRYCDVTWQELWVRIGNFGRDYISFFFGDDGDQIPSMDDRLNVLEDIFVLEDPEFPYIQLAADASEALTNVIPAELVKYHTQTEFGVDISCYSEADYSEVCELLKERNKTIVPLSFRKLNYELPQ